MFITLSRNPEGSGFIVKAGEGREVFDFFQQALKFGIAEANRRGWSLVNKVDDDVPATQLSRTRKGI